MMLFSREAIHEIFFAFSAEDQLRLIALTRWEIYHVMMMMIRCDQIPLACSKVIPMCLFSHQSMFHREREEARGAADTRFRGNITSIVSRIDSPSRSHGPFHSTSRRAPLSDATKKSLLRKKKYHEVTRGSSSRVTPRKKWGPVVASIAAK